jgi:hypothetical protein
MTKKKPTPRQKKIKDEKKQDQTNFSMSTTITMDDSASQALINENSAMYNLLRELNNELLNTRLKLTKTKMELDKLKHPTDLWTYTTGKQT